METQFIDLEKKYWHGMETHDYETVKNLTRFPCLIAGKDGVRSVDEGTFEKMFKSGEGDKIKVVNFSDIETQMIGSDGAVIAYVIELSVIDDQQKPPVKCACTSTWVKEDTKWVCALHTETELL